MAFGIQKTCVTSGERPAQISQHHSAPYRNRLLICSTVMDQWRFESSRSHQMNLERITNNIEVDQITQCWEWTRSCSSSGYGQLTEQGEYWNAHVYSWVIHNGPRPDKQVIRHRCHNKKCCNPDHLLSGTYKENWLDSEISYKAASTKRRASWSVYGTVYPTCRDAVNETGVSMHSIIKYTHQGVFDAESYEDGCVKGKRRHS